MSREGNHLSSKLFLLKEMVVRDIRARYAGSGLGVVWAFLHPVLWMVLYTAVFSVVLRVPVEKGFATSSSAERHVHATLRRLKLSLPI